MDYITSFIIWIFIVLIIVLLTSNYGVRYRTGIAIALIIASIVLYGLSDKKDYNNNVFLLSLLLAVVYVIMYIIINMAEEISYHNYETNNQVMKPSF